MLEWNREEEAGGIGGEGKSMIDPEGEERRGEKEVV